MIQSTLRSTLAATAALLAACNGQMLIAEDETIDDRWKGNAPDCPPVANEDAPCDVAEGQICVYDNPVVTGSYLNRLCGCWEASAAERRWHCYEDSTTQWDCPKEQPAHGADCYGLYGAECMYPERTLCSCSAESGVFSCLDMHRTDFEAPPSDPADQPIPTLTDEQRADWCDWFATAHQSVGFGLTEPAPVPPDEEGFTVARGCWAGWEFHCLALIPTISSDECEANLRLSSCAAPISELTDCVSTVYDSCWPSPHGCARYLERPGCSGTIAVSNDGNIRTRDPRGPDYETTSCRIRIQ